MLQLCSSSTLQNIPDLAPQMGKGILYHHAGLTFPSSIAVLCFPLFLFGWKTLKFLLWIQEVLVQLIRDILKFGLSIFFLINWEAGFSKLFHALASGVSGAVLVRVVLWGVTDAISSVPVVVCVVVHPEHSMSLAQVRQCSGPVVGCKMIYCTFHFLRIELWNCVYSGELITVCAGTFSFFQYYFYCGISLFHVVYNYQFQSGRLGSGIQ